MAGAPAICYSAVMIILFGRKTKERPLGWVAEFCPICREIQACELRSLERVFHLYLVPLSRRQIAEELICTECGYGARIAAKQFRYVAEKRASTHALEASTNDDLRAVIHDRLAFESRLKSGSLSHEERIDAIAEPLALAQPYIENRARRGGSESMLAVLIFVLMIACVVTAVVILDPQVPNWLKITAGAGSSGLLAVIIYLSATQSRREARRFGLPLVARSLAPLHPRRDEIEQALSKLRESRKKVWKWFRPHEIEQAAESFRREETSR